jgi:hypothetical protein
VTEAFCNRNANLVGVLAASAAAYAEEVFAARIPHLLIDQSAIDVDLVYALRVRHTLAPVLSDKDHRLGANTFRERLNGLLRLAWSGGYCLSDLLTKSLRVSFEFRICVEAICRIHVTLGLPGVLNRFYDLIARA